MFHESRPGLRALAMAVCLAWAIPAQAMTVSPPTDTTITFETDANGATLDAPVLFSNPYRRGGRGDPGALPLTDLYEPLGVVWAGNGAILREPSNFGVTGFSAPNFLAYNSIATFANGAQVGVTDTMSFAAGQREVAFNVGQGIGDPEQFFAYAFDEFGNLVDSYLETPDGNALIAIVLAGPGIRSVQYGLVDGTGTFVFDDLSLTAVPIPAALPLLLSALAGLGVFSWRRRRKATAA